jgi:polar amino acid transport system ATP-binding protein
MSLVEIKNLTKRFGDNLIWENVNESIEKGDVVVIVGNSGCGKTTFLRSINLLETPTSGQIFIDGEEITAKGADIDKIRSKMGMVYQSFNLFSHLTVLENVIKAPMLVNKVPKAQAIKEGMEYLRMVGMQERADFMPSQLSGGQKQRVAIARCLAMKPEIILFDEPTSALDPSMVDEVLAVIRNLAKNGMTCVIVTHEMTFAKNVASKIIFFAEKGIYEEAPPLEFFNHPKRERTIAFVRKLKTYTYESAVEDIDIYTVLAQVTSYCSKYAFTSRVATRVHLVAEELLTGLQTVGGTGTVTLTVTYEEATGKKEVVLRHNILDGAMEMLDEFSEMIINNCASEVKRDSENGYKVMTVCIKE